MPRQNCNSMAVFAVTVCSVFTTIDDLGIEPVEVMDYGNIMTPVIDLLTKRYEAQLFTIVTTNLDPKDIRKRYGDRIADRLNEMMAKIVYRNPTYRTDEIQANGMG